jgi:flagellar L-ring protein precursor FlgH
MKKTTPAFHCAKNRPDDAAAARPRNRSFSLIPAALAAVLSILGAAGAHGGERDRPRGTRQSSLDVLISDLERTGRLPAAGSPGSLYETGGRLADLARDQRAARVHDIVTIVVADRASALSRGSTTANRKAQANGGIVSLAGPVRAAGPLGQMANLGSKSQLDGQGETSRESVLETTLSARVTHVLPSGDLVVEGTKDVWINSERQRITVRGLVRWNDLNPGNRVSSDRLADLEVRVDGKGVVQDAIRRPNFLYRLLMGLLPF